MSPELVIFYHLNYCADYYAQKPAQRAGVPWRTIVDDCLTLLALYKPRLISTGSPQTSTLASN
eukprot:COSAG01_NODE_12753_length_1690_cov_24.654305_3_plen_62_part_01